MFSIEHDFDATVVTLVDDPAEVGGLLLEVKYDDGFNAWINGTHVAGANVDSDEVLYYVEGNFMSRKGINEGSFTVHPNGIPHGPHPGTYEGSIGKTGTEELAVMVDTFKPLKIARAAREVEDHGYWKSWQP